MLRHSPIRFEGLSQEALTYLQEQSVLRKTSRSNLMGMLIKAVCSDKLVTALLDDEAKLTRAKNERLTRPRKRNAVDQFNESN